MTFFLAAGIGICIGIIGTVVFVAVATWRMPS